MCVEGANPDLNQPPREALFHHARERARVRVAIVVERVVEIGVSIEVQDGEAIGRPAGRAAGVLRAPRAIGAQDRIGDRMIAAKNQRPPALTDDVADALLDGCAHVDCVAAKDEIAPVDQNALGG